MATLLDTPMDAPDAEPQDNNRTLSQDADADADAEPQTDAPEDEDDEDFHFDAPSYYDLKNPALERRYVNNADGYFSSPAPSNATSKASPLTAAQERLKPEKSCEKGAELTSYEKEREEPITRSLAASYEKERENNDAQGDADEQMEETDGAMLDTTMGESEVEQVLSRSRLLEDRPETFEEVFRQYASSSQSSATSSYLLHELDTSTHSSSHGVFSPHSSQTSSSSAVRAGRNAQAISESMSDAASARSKTRHSGDGLSSKLMQPTQSYLRRLQAEQHMREQSFMEDIPAEEKPHRVTKPRSPRLHARTRPTNPNDPSRMSSTSRELLKIQEERLHLQLEKLKIREFHEKTKVQRPPSNVHQRSTKQLTIPQSPHFQVDNRVRRFHSSASESSVDSSHGSESGQEKVRPPIAAETLLSRDYALPRPPLSKETRPTITQTPHSPQLHTASRAALRPPPAPMSREQEKSATHDYSRAKFGGLTQPVTPQLQTSRRAATHRRPVEVIDHDAEELAKKFHARPVNKSILQPKSYPRYSPAKSEGKARLTQPQPPKPSTSARSVSRSASERAASVTAELERHRKERELRLKARQGIQPKSAPSFRRGPVIPETPPLKSIQLHREYQEKFRRRIDAEEQEREKQRQFRANPMQVTSTPAKFDGSSKPLTEVMPFQLPGERFHEQAQERLEQKRRGEAEQLKNAGNFRARPMPVFGATNKEGAPMKSSEKPLTQVVAPTLATDRRAAERAAFDAAERERRQREEAFHEQREAQQRQQKEEEIKHLRREQMIFHARPVPESKPFMTKYDTKPLTEPVSPILRS